VLAVKVELVLELPQQVKVLNMAVVVVDKAQTTMLVVQEEALSMVEEEEVVVAVNWTAELSQPVVLVEILTPTQ
jgi:hypothetical protein